MGARSGFTLFEVLVAFAIMAIVLSAMLPGQTALLHRVSSTEERTLAMDYAVSLAELDSLSAKTTPGSSEFDYRNWHVERDLKTMSKTTAELTILIRSADGQELARLQSTRPIR